jgi:hypothetical protein
VTGFPDIVRSVNRQLLRSTVGAQIFCPIAAAKGAPECGRILDARSSVAVWIQNRIVAVGCADCIEPILERSRAKGPDPEGLEVIRGADLW